MVAIATSPLAAWSQRGRFFFSTRDGRFDLMLTSAGDWLAIDWDVGRSTRGCQIECLVWCKSQEQGP
jgi:hypothetical protein